MENKKTSSNVEDRKDKSSSSFGRGLGSGKLNPILVATLIKFLFSKTGLIIAGILFIISFATGTNFLTFIGNLNGVDGNSSQIQSTEKYNGTAAENEMAELSNRVLRSTEDVWNILIPNYKEPTLVLFIQFISSTCGTSSIATGDFVLANLIAHEVSYHIQNITGTS